MKMMIERSRWMSRATILAATAAVLSGCGGGDGASTGAASGSTPGASTPGASTPTYRIGGTISGLAPQNKLTLLDNGGDALTASANGTFTFPTPIAFNTGYAATVSTQPLWQWCSVANGSGTATADISNVAVACAAARAQVSTFAGSTTSGSGDGTGTSASFNRPAGTAMDASGNVYVADSQNHEIRKISPTGVVTTLAGSPTHFGSTDGVGAAASFKVPEGIAVDASGNAYVADFGANTIRKISPVGVVTTLAGTTVPGSADGVGKSASFSNPAGVAVDAAGNVYIADAGNNMIRKINPYGVVTTLAGSPSAGWADGVGNAATFQAPTAVALDSKGNVYVADQDNNMIRMISPDGVVTTLAGSPAPGWADGTGTSAKFIAPSGITVDASGNVYVVDTGNNVIRAITPAGVVTTLAGSLTAGAADGIGAAASFKAPFGIAVDAGGNLYIGEPNNQEIRRIIPIP